MSAKAGHDTKTITPLSVTIDLPSQNNPVISSPDDIFCRQDQDCAFVFQHKKIKSSYLVNDEPFKDDMDSDTMLKIIKDMQSSLIDGTNSRMPFLAAQSDVDLLTGAPFSDMVLPDNDFLGTCSKPSTGQDLGFVQDFGSQIEEAVFVPGNHSGSHGLHGVPQHSNGLMQFNEKVAFQNNTTENTFRDNERKGKVSSSVVHMDEYSFTDFVPLPLVEVESILSNDQCTYAMTSNSASLTTYGLPPRQPMTGYPSHQAYHTNSFKSNEQLPQCVGGGYELHPSINTLPYQDIMCKDNGLHYKACTEPFNAHAAGSEKLP
ncbi:hypothetical protein QZH41_010986 [Actinostola sp. cb2023]|nr:hypothetical protein QZH41_010986 [Actinostola sp. cb2023]